MPISEGRVTGVNPIVTGATGGARVKRKMWEAGEDSERCIRPHTTRVEAIGIVLEQTKLYLSLR